MDLFSNLPGTDPKESAIDAVHQATAIYTTLSVVDGVLDRLNWPQSGGRLLDPSAGDGAFLVVAIRRLAPAPGDRETLSRVTGYEFHGGAVGEARLRVAAELRMLGWNASDAGAAAMSVVVQRDFILEGADGVFTCLAGNPPYLRYARLPDYFKHHYSAVVAKYALGDLLHAFLDQASKVLSANGAIGLVTSDRWLFNQSAAELRSQIGRHVGIEHLERLDVTTSFYRPKLWKVGSLPRVHPVAVIMRPNGIAASPITSSPISPDGFAADAWTGPTLADKATVRLAPWLGPHGIFTIDAPLAATLGSEADLVPVVDTDDFNPRTNQLAAPSRFAIRTQRETEPCALVAKHLQSTCHQMPKRGQRGPYWTPPEKLPTDTGEPSLMVPRIARRIRVIDLPAGVTPINHNLSVIRAGADGPSLDEVRAVLESDEAHDWLMRNAPRLENGYFSITTTLLRRLPYQLPAMSLQKAA